MSTKPSFDGPGGHVRIPPLRTGIRTNWLMDGEADRRRRHGPDRLREGIDDGPGTRPAA